MVTGPHPGYVASVSDSIGWGGGAPARKSPRVGLPWELALMQCPLPTDNQSEYSVGSEEEDEDFDERPEGGTCFLISCRSSSRFTPWCPLSPWFFHKRVLLC